MSKPSAPDRGKRKLFQDPEGGYVVARGKGFLACHQRVRQDWKQVLCDTLEQAKSHVTRAGANVRKWRAFKGDRAERGRYITCRIRMNGELNGRTEILDTTIDGGEGEPLIVATFFDHAEAEKFCIAANTLEGGAR